MAVEQKAKPNIKRIIIDCALSVLILILVIPLAIKGDKLFSKDSPLSSVSEMGVSLDNATDSSRVPQLRETIKFIKSRYIRDISTLELINCSIDMINYTMDKFGHGDMRLKNFTDAQAKEFTNDELIRVFEFKFSELLAKVEALPKEQRLLHRSQMKKTIEATTKKLEAQRKARKDKEGDKKTQADTKQARANEAYEDMSFEREFFQALHEENSSEALRQEQLNSDKNELSKDSNKDDKDDLVKDEDGKPVVLDKTYLLYAALNGMVNATGDPFSAAISPKSIKAMSESLGDSNYGGVGIYLESDLRNNRQLTVIEPIDGTPASKKDILPGDKIMAIDGKKTANLDVSEASALIRGEIGSVVVLTLQRGQRTFEVALERASIHVPSVSTKIINKDVGYMRVRFFGAETTKEFSDALDKVVKDGAKVLIIDLRNNGGGYINAAIGLCSEFLPYKKLITSVVNPRFSTEEIHEVNTKKTNEMPLIVLVNGFSASASEITAGAMRDYSRALLLGELTYGKGSVQTIESLTGGGAIKLTIAHYLTPNNKDIHLKGIEPDIKFESVVSNKLGNDKDLLLKLAVKEADLLLKEKVGNEISATTLENAKNLAKEWENSPEISKQIAKEKADFEALVDKLKKEEQEKEAKDKQSK